MLTSLPYIKSACPSENKTPYKWVIVRLKEVMFQPGLPKQFAVSSEVCFYDCSGFRVNELKFHFSGAPCICQHILQIESRAGLASAHFSHRLFNRQQSSQTLPRRQGVGGVVVVRAFLMQRLYKNSSRAQRTRFPFICSLRSPLVLLGEPNRVTLLPSWGKKKKRETINFTHPSNFYTYLKRKSRKSIRWTVKLKT